MTYGPRKSGKESFVGFASLIQLASFPVLSDEGQPCVGIAPRIILNPILQDANPIMR